eukprot:6273065-Prymnesium_polylepis.1
MPKPILRNHESSSCPAGANGRQSRSSRTSRTFDWRRRNGSARANCSQLGQHPPSDKITVYQGLSEYVQRRDSVCAKICALARARTHHLRVPHLGDLSGPRDRH